MKNVRILLFAICAMLCAPVLLAARASDDIKSYTIGVDDDRESAADYFFRVGVLTRHRETKKVTLDEQAFMDNSDELSWLWTRLSSRPLSSPLSITVGYADAFKTRLSEVVSTTSFAISDPRYAHAESMKLYLLASIPELEKLLQEGYQPASLSFEEAQHEKFVAKTSLVGEKLHICGLTEEMEQLLLSQLKSKLNERGMRPLYIYFFGSRVMPRSDVIKRDPSFLNTMPINDDGVIKNAVRIKGLTEISDLEVLVLFSSETDKSKEDLRGISKGFRQGITKKFREFPVSLKLLQVKQNDTIEDAFKYLDLSYQKMCNKPMSKHQFVQIYP